MIALLNLLDLSIENKPDNDNDGSFNLFFLDDGDSNSDRVGFWFRIYIQISFIHNQIDSIQLDNGD